MTANAMSGDRELCLIAGMNDHIGKPIDVDQLFATMARWIKPKHPPSSPLGESVSPRAQRDAPLPPITGLDLPLALRRIGGNVQLARKLIRRFGQTQSDAIERIQSALDRQDVDTATREVHTTKGLAGNIGATQMSVLAGEVETLLKHGALEDVPPALQAMAQEMEKLLDAITQAMGPSEKSEPEPLAPTAVDRMAFDDSLRQLSLLLADDDSSAAKMVERIADPLRGLGQGAVGQQLQSLISKYEFEEALKVLKETALRLGIEV
jgi:two-component system, sensor histidine kinase and response regulator